MGPVVWEEFQHDPPHTARLSGIFFMKTHHQAVLGQRGPVNEILLSLAQASGEW